MLDFESIQEKQVGDVTIYSTLLEMRGQEILPIVIKSEIPYVWHLDHMPNRVVQWWDASLPLTQNGSNHNLEVRNLSFDIQYDTASFLEVADELLNMPIFVIQSNKKMPDTLLLGNDQDQNDRILVQNGFYLSLSMPYPHEHALLKTTDKAHLENVIKKI